MNSMSGDPESTARLPVRSIEYRSLCCTACVRQCAGFRTPAALISPHALLAGVRKAPRHEIASGGSGKALPREGGAAKRLWGFGPEPAFRAICVGCPPRLETQLRRYGMDIAKWGFEVSGHMRFQRVRRGKNITCHNFGVARFATVDRPKQCH